MQTDLLAVMRRQDSERRHSIDGKRLGNSRSERLGKERDTPLRLASGREELSAEALVALRDEERRSTKTAATVLSDINLVVEELLDVFDRQEMLAVHRDDDSVPDLRY